MNTTERGLLIASAAAALFISGAVVARATDKANAEVHCAGLNACKGQGACASAENSCKGKGFVDVSSADECAKKGGKVIEAKPKS